jgi:hypothetical protein
MTRSSAAIYFFPSASVSQMQLSSLAIYFFPPVAMVIKLLYTGGTGRCAFIFSHLPWPAIELAVVRKQRSPDTIVWVLAV